MKESKKALLTVSDHFKEPARVLYDVVLSIVLVGRAGIAYNHRIQTANFQ